MKYNVKNNKDRADRIKRMLGLQGEDNDSEYYTAHEGRGRYQITKPPISETDVPKDIVKTVKKQAEKTNVEAEERYQKDILDILDMLNR